MLLLRLFSHRTVSPSPFMNGHHPRAAESSSECIDIDTETEDSLQYLGLLDMDAAHVPCLHCIFSCC